MRDARHRRRNRRYNGRSAASCSHCHRDRDKDAPGLPAITRPGPTWISALARRRRTRSALLWSIIAARCLRIAGAPSYSFSSLCPLPFSLYFTPPALCKLHLECPRCLSCLLLPAAQPYFPYFCLRRECSFSRGYRIFEQLAIFAREPVAVC